MFLWPMAARNGLAYRRISPAPEMDSRRGELAAVLADYAAVELLPGGGLERAVRLPAGTVRRAADRPRAGGHRPRQRCRPAGGLLIRGDRFVPPPRLGRLVNRRDRRGREGGRHRATDAACRSHVETSAGRAGALTPVIPALDARSLRHEEETTQRRRPAYGLLRAGDCGGQAHRCRNRRDPPEGRRRRTHTEGSSGRQGRGSRSPPDRGPPTPPGALGRQLSTRGRGTATCG